MNYSSDDGISKGEFPYMPLTHKISLRINDKLIQM